MTTYAIIGAGAIGSALAERFTAAQIPAIIANSRGPASLSSVTDRFGASVKAVELKDALQADVVILAVPYDSIADIVTQVSDWGGQIVVDASNALIFRHSNRVISAADYLRRSCRSLCLGQRW